MNKISQMLIVMSISIFLLTITYVSAYTSQSSNDRQTHLSNDNQICQLESQINTEIYKLRDYINYDSTVTGGNPQLQQHIITLLI
jgi:hypothetical protein